jgi:hypothetical protein
VEEHRLRVFENRVMRKILRPWSTEYWRKLYSEEFHDLYSSPNIIRVIKSRRIGWAGHAVCMGKRYIHGIDGET